MRKLFVLFLPLVLLLGLPVMAQQETQTSDPSGPGGGGRMRRHHDAGLHAGRRLGHLTRRLNLTQEQQASLKPIFADEAKQIEALRQDTSLTLEQRRAKIHELRQNTNSQITSVLTPEQQKLWEELQQKRQQRRQQKGPGGPEAVKPQS
jgi:Spy/CpxP family protein refolding chaperone